MSLATSVGRAGLRHVARSTSSTAACARRRLLRSTGGSARSLAVAPPAASRSALSNRPPAWKRTVGTAVRPAGAGDAARLAWDTRFFSASAVGRSHGESDRWLVAELDKEIKHEGSQDPVYKDEGEQLTDFLSKNGWALEATPGCDELRLTKRVGNERVTVILFLSDINFLSGDSDAPVEKSRPLTVRAHVAIEKPGKGVLFYYLAFNGERTGVQCVSFFDSMEHAVPKNIDKDFARGCMYAGPNFGDLDEDLQVAFHAYLEERGVDQNFALITPRLIELREQGEYLIPSASGRPLSVAHSSLGKDGAYTPSEDGRGTRFYVQGVVRLPFATQTNISSQFRSQQCQPETWNSLLGTNDAEGGGIVDADL